MRFMSLRHRFHILCMIALLSSASVFATWQVPVINYSPEDYAAGTQNWQLAMKSNGWVYAANNHGLLEYDGNMWCLYGVWNSSILRSVMYSQDGQLYVGATNDFGVFRPDSLGGVKYQSLTDQLTEVEKQFGEIWSISEIGSVRYFQAPHHIYKLSEEGDIQTISSHARIHTCTVNDGALYVATTEGLAVLSGTKLVVLHGSEQLHGLEVRSLLPLEDDKLLIVTDFSGLFVLDDNVIRPWKTDADKYLRENQLYSCAYQNGKLALGTVMGGVVIMDIDGHNCLYVNHQKNLQNNTVLSLAFDYRGNLWAGLDQGIDCILLSSPLRFLSGEGDYGSGYAAAVYKGDLYIGTNQGLYRLKNFDVNHPYQSENALEFVQGSLGQVWSLAEADGELYCCHNRGLFRVRGSRVENVCNEEGFWRVVELDDKSWLIGSYRGFYVLTEGKVRRLTGVDDTALHFSVDTDGVVWLYTARGLQRIEINESRDHLRAQYVSSEQMAPYVPVAVDEEGYQWTIKDDAVVVTSPEGKSTELLRRHMFVAGFANILCIGNGKALIGGLDGFYLADRCADTHRDLWSEVERLYVRRVRLVSSDRTTIFGDDGSGAKLSNVELPAGTYTMEFQLGGLFAQGENIQFATYLEPIEKDYRPWSSQNHTSYTMLGDGHYTLHAKALLGGELYETSFSFRVLPMWYETALAFFVYVLLGVLILIFLVWYVYQRILESKRRFEQEKLEELRESKMKILELENEKNQIELHAKSQELSNLLLNQINKNELATEVLGDLHRIMDELEHKDTQAAIKRLRQLQERMARNTENARDWTRFEENFDVVNASFLKNLSKHYPWMSKNEKKLCAYIKMGLLTKEIAPIMGLTMRGAEMLRYRMRQKMELDAQVNLKEFFDTLES